MATKPKEEEKSKLRVPGQKKSLGLKIPMIAMPHDSLVMGLGTGNAEPTPLTPLTPLTLDNVTQPTPLIPDAAPHSPQPTPAPLTALTSPTPRSAVADESPAAPARDFHKMDNSVTRGIPEYFRAGKIKLIYDVLYQRSRGAIRPSKTIQISRAELMHLAGIGSRNTMDKAMKRLAEMGLVTQTFLLGDRSGNIYEVRTPKELGYPEDLTQPTPPTPHHPTPLSLAQNLDNVRGAESAQSGVGQQPINIGESAVPKTLFKDFSYDDEQRLRETLDRFATMARETTGREVTSADIDSLCEILHLVMDETEIAAGRASSITFFGKFATENLRRRLAMNRRQGPKVAIFDPGKPDSMIDDSAVQVLEYAPDPLDVQGRSKALDFLKDILKNMGPEYMEKYYRTNYTEEDWVWLIENLSTEA